jgi:methylenetetrahydrofolate reductase (NADPH)
VKWGGIQTLLEEAPCDVLILLDCCASGTASASEGNGVNEVISACAYNQIANGVGPYSFTSALVVELKKLSRKSYFSVGELYRNIFLRVQNREEVLGGRRAGRHPAPIHLILTQDDPPRSIQLSARDFSIESGQIDGSASEGHTQRKETQEEDNSTLPNHPKSESSFEIPTGLKADNNPRLAFAIRLTNTFQPGEDMLHLFTEWLRSFPTIAENVDVKVEGCFDSFSTLVIVSLPIAVASYLPRDPAIMSLGPITSSNRLVIANATVETEISAVEQKTPGIKERILPVSPRNNLPLHVKTPKNPDRNVVGIVGGAGIIGESDETTIGQVYSNEKISDKIAALSPHSEYFSLEFFPPKTEMGFSNLRTRLERMARALRPLFVTVTWGAGGATASKSLELAQMCQTGLGLTTCLHMTCTNTTRASIDEALETAKSFKIRNILALKGDPVRTDGKRDTTDFESAVDLVRYIKRKYRDYFCIGVGAYPEGHPNESYRPDLNLKPSVEHDLPYLMEKVQAGADFILTQLFFDTNAYDSFEERLRTHPSGLFTTIPIIPGLMPIQSYQTIMRTAKLSRARLPPHILDLLQAVKADDELVKKVGVNIMVKIIRQIKARPSQGPRGFHFYTLNLEKSVSLILERTMLIPPSPPLELPNSVASFKTKISGHSASRQAYPSRSDPSRQYMLKKPPTSDESGPEFNSRQDLIESSLSRATTLAISDSLLSTEAVWDDFPNGRWGDARSPAYGEIDGYGVTLHMSQTQAIGLWRYPKTVSDITWLFTQYIRGVLPAIPWSEDKLNEESASIRNSLLALNNKDWWTVASQPAVNGVKSSDPVFGWGPKNGFVFQKAFVEFFISSSDWKILREKLTDTETRQIVTFYACNASGDFETSNKGDASSNAVTWGAFTGKEIITPTIIEEVSFRAWAKEAFEIWTEWGKIYPIESESRNIIEEQRSGRWLVSIIHHGYVDGDALWRLLLE